MNDPRITPTGRVLRMLRLDELPQLYNIVKGEMSLIGSQPEREIFVLESLEPVSEMREGRRVRDQEGVQVVCGYRERVPQYRYRLLVKPGITGWARVHHYCAASLEDTKEKLEYDLYYIKHAIPAGSGHPAENDSHRAFRQLKIRLAPCHIFP
jgi:lipopolysaccharide/colanic/teichoic acid biosynthesis glycosyltransferase